MKSLSDLWRVLAEELASRCQISTQRDYKTVTRRVQKEGFSFLTITLPSFAKDFERCLEEGSVDSRAFAGFKRQAGLPCFLRGFLELTFELKSGVWTLRESPNIEAIFAVRQLCYLYQKILLPCTDAREAGAMFGYMETDRELGEVFSRVPLVLREEFKRIRLLLFSDVLTAMDKFIYDGNIVPKHGPGATADRRRGNAKFDLSYWPQRLETVFPYGEYGIPNWRYYYQLDRVEFAEPGAEIPVKVISVPKTLKTPRIIAIEPTCMQYMQQAMLNPLVELLEAKRVEGSDRPNLCEGFLGFTDQEPNRDLAREASHTRSMATLDLSEASDRVSNELVIDLLDGFPHFSEAVQATRSTKARVLAMGDEYTITLNKFASMGSALTFPMEAMVFLTIVFMGVLKASGLPPTRGTINSFRGKVRIVGDDIIVPSGTSQTVIEYLELFGFKVNAHKSFWRGFFRESCGGDYYDGESVRPARFRRTLPQSRSDVPEVISLVEFRNTIYSMGLWQTTRYLDEKIAEVLPHFPIVQDTSPCVGRRSVLPYEAERQDESLHRPLVRGYVTSSKIPKSFVSGEGALLKCLIKDGDEPFQDVRHLERQGRPSSVGIKARWVTPY